MNERWARLNSRFLHFITRGRYETYEIEEIRRIRLLYIGTSLGIVILIILGTIAFMEGVRRLLLIDYGLAALLLLILFITRQTQHFRFGLYAVIGFYTLLCHYLLITGGAFQSGYVWCFTYPLIAFFGLGSRQGAIAAALLIVPILFLFSLDDPPGIVAAYSPAFRIRFVAAFLMISVMVYVVERVREDTQTRLEVKNAEVERAAAELRMTGEKLQQAGEELERRVAERTRQLAEANGHLTQEMNERRQAEEALRQSEEKYRLIAQNTADVITVLDMNLHTTYVSPSIVRTTGYTIEEAVGLSLDEYLTPDSLRVAMTAFAEEMAREAAGTADPARIRMLELEQYRKDGSIVCFEVGLSFLRDREGKAAAILAVSRDISERKQAEAEKIRLEERLQQAQKLESIGTLAGGIAHDFNNLLMVIQGHTSLMLYDLSETHPHYGRLKRIEEQVAQAADLTKQLLGFARGGRYEMLPADMNGIIDRTSAMFGRTRKDISIEKRPAPDLWTVTADRGQMEQVLMNLYVNAGQAMPGGGVLVLETENCRLTEEQARPYDVPAGTYVKISVSDTGTGMDEKTRLQIFDPFFTTKAMGQGAGLGLAVVYGIVKGHEGAIEVASEPGEGTTFTIFLPAEETATEAEGTTPAKGATGAEKFLVVDDEEAVLEVSRHLLEALGYGVYTAKSGQEAVAICEEKRGEIVLVILDMVMPGMSGGETFDRLRGIDPDIPVILASGYSVDGAAQEILDRGCNGFLQKPFSLTGLSQKVQDILGRDAAG